MTIDDIKELFKIDETRCVELKKSTGELKDGMHSLCAMLNSDGGYVIFGIAPKSLKIIGQMVTDNTRQSKWRSKMSVKNVSQNDGLNNRQIKIKIMIRDNDRITVTLISNALGVTPRTIYRDLKIIGIHWEGSPKTGHWVFD